MITQLRISPMLLCKEVIKENLYTLEACFGTKDVDKLYNLIISCKDTTFWDAILKIVRTRV